VITLITGKTLANVDFGHDPWIPGANLTIVGNNPSYGLIRMNPEIPPGNSHGRSRSVPYHEGSLLSGHDLDLFIPCHDPGSLLSLSRPCSSLSCHVPGSLHSLLWSGIPSFPVMIRFPGYNPDRGREHLPVRSRYCWPVFAHLSASSGYAL